MKINQNIIQEEVTDIKKTSQNEIYNAVRVYTSDCCCLGKSYLIKREIKDNKDDYHYFGVGDDITKDELFKKLEKFIKYEIRGKPNVGIHLDLFYTKKYSFNEIFSIFNANH